MTSLLTSCHIPHVCSLLVNFYEWVKYHTTTNCAKDQYQIDQCPLNSADLNPLDYHVWCAMLQAFHKTSVKAKDHPRAKKCTAADLG